LELKHNPKTPVEAQFSLPFTVASAFIKGDVFIDEVSEQALKNQEVLELTQRIMPTMDQNCNKGTSVGSLIMEIKTRSGKTLTRRVDYPKGNPKNPASMDDCINKFRKCVNYSAQPFPKGQIEKIVELVSDLEELEDVTILAKLLVPQPNRFFN
jgi:2-methylcitrate dehydratase PrpD